MVTSSGFKVYITPESSSWGWAPAGATSAAANSNVWTLLPSDPNSGVDVVETLFDDARRGQGVLGFRQLAGVLRTELSVSSPFYPEESGYLIRSILGPDTFTAMSATWPATHVFDIESMATADGRSFHMQIVDDTDATYGYTHKGCMVTQMAIRFNVGEGLVTQESTIMGKGMTSPGDSADAGNGIRIAKRTTADNTNDPFRGWQSRVNLGTLSGSLLDGEINIARNSDLLYVARASRFPLKMVPGLMEITGRMTATFEGATQLDLYRNITNEPVQLCWSYIPTNGGAATVETLNIEFPKLSYADSPAEIDRSGNNMTIAFNFRALLGATTSSFGAANVQTPIRIRLLNTQNLAYTAGV